MSAQTFLSRPQIHGQNGDRGVLARAIIETALIQTAIWHPETWRPIFTAVLSLADFVDSINCVTWRALVLANFDFVEAGQRVREDLTERDWYCWVDRFGGACEFFLVGDPPVEEMLEVLREDEDEALIDFCNEWRLFD